MAKPNRTHVAGLLLLVVLFTLGVGVGVAVAQLPAEAGDLLSFAGALIGVGLTVAGAVYLLEHQRQREAAIARRVLRELLIAILESIGDARKATPIPGTENEYVPAIAAVTHLDRTQEQIVAVQKAREWFAPTSAAMVRAYVQIEKMAVDVEAVRADVRPAVMYGGVPDIERHIGQLETRVRLALAELNLPEV